jgi:mRNA interferase RelE/StbE
VPYTAKYHPDVKNIDLPPINVKMRERIRRAIESRLKTAPQDYGLPLRKSLGGYWKLRVGDYRIVYTIREKILVVLVVRIGHRKDIYRKL